MQNNFQALCDEVNRKNTQKVEKFFLNTNSKENHIDKHFYNTLIQF